jgi:hypothetical protein
MLTTACFVELVKFNEENLNPPNVPKKREETEELIIHYKDFKSIFKLLNPLINNNSKLSALVHKLLCVTPRLTEITTKPDYY